MTESTRLDRFLAHKDLLLLQIGNWISGQLLFAVFGAFAPRNTLTHAAFLEVASAFFGTTCASVAFRIGFGSVMATRGLVIARVTILLAMSCCAIGGWIDWTWVVGVAPSLLTPAHFPIVHGARSIAVISLVGLRVSACAALAWSTLSPGLAFVLYFAPGTAYALVLYVVHFGDWAQVRTPSGSERVQRPAQVRGAGRAIVDMLVLLPLTSAGLFLMQAMIVSRIASVSPTLAVFERLLRSCYSLVYPYLMRMARFDVALRRGVAPLGFIAPVTAATSGFVGYSVLWVGVPTAIDLVTTNLFRLDRSRLIVIMVCVGVCAGLLTWGTQMY